MKNETKTAGELDIEIRTLRRNRDALEKTNRQAAADVGALCLLLDVVETSFAMKGGDRLLRDRCALAVERVETFVGEYAGLRRDVLTLEATLEKMGEENLSPAALALEHKKEINDWGQSLELAKRHCYEAIAAKKKLAERNRVLEAELDRWEKFGTDVIRLSSEQPRRKLNIENADTEVVIDFEDLGGSISAS